MSGDSLSPKTSPGSNTTLLLLGAAGVVAVGYLLLKNRGTANTAPAGGSNVSAVKNAPPTFPPLKGTSPGSGPYAETTLPVVLSGGIATPNQLPIGAGVKFIPAASGAVVDKIDVSPSGVLAYRSPIDAPDFTVMDAKPVTVTIAWHDSVGSHVDAAEVAGVTY